MLYQYVVILLLAKAVIMMGLQPYLRLILVGCILMISLFPPANCQNSHNLNIADSAAFQKFMDGFDDKKLEELKPLVDSIQGYMVQEAGYSQTIQARTAYLMIRYLLKFPDENKLQAMINWVRSLPLTIENQNDASLMIRVINNLGVALKRVSRISESQEAYFKAIDILQKMRDPDVQMLGSLYANVGNIYRQKGEYERSLSYFQQAISAFNDCISDPNRKDKPYRNKAQSLNNLGLVYQNLDNQEKAIEAFSECIQITESLEIQSEDMAYTNLTNSLMESGRLSEADSLCLRILEKRNSDAIKDRIYVLASINQAQLRAQLHGDTLGAIRQLDAIRREIGNIMPQAFDLKTESVLQELALMGAMNKFQEALTLNEQAIREIMISPDDQVLKNDPNSIKSYWSTDLINLMLNLAGLYRDLGLARNEIPLLRTSVRYYDAVTSLIDSVRSGLQLQSSQMELSRRQERSFDEMVELGYQLFQMTREEQDLSAMFEFIELSKSAGLWSSIRETEKKKRILTEEDRLREQDLNHQIADIQSLINEQLTLENPNQARLKELQGLNFTLNRKKDSLVRIFTDKYPELKNAASGPVLISLKEARNLLAKDEAMLQFSYSTGTIYCIALTSGRQEVISIQIDSAIRENIRFIVNFMKGGYSSFNGRERQEFNRSASHLYGKLIAPFEKIITGKNLIIIPDGPLNLVPFEALIMPDDGKSSGNYITNNYLIRRYTVSYALSATLFNYKPLVSIQPGKAILAVAPVYDPVKIEHSELLRSRSEELPQLKGTLEEARSAYKLLSGKLLTGTKAKESTFKSICQDYAVIHLAMHTVTDPKDPMNTFLVFTPEADRKEDGLLFSREVYNLNLGASLVVLSACETGSGEMAAGEGIISLGRGFMFAGCPNMVITLWRVDDESGKHIMKMFYQNLQEGQAISTALRNSKLMYIESADEVHAHPHFWAAFSAMGPDIPVELGQKDSSPWHLFVIPFLLLAGVLILVQKRKSPPGDGDMVETD